MKTIILVEDDPAIQDVLQMIFEDPEYRMIICSKGDDIFKDGLPVPDIYLLDKQLSGMDGLELCRVLKTREKTKEVPVILLSAIPNIKQMAVEAGADGAVEKPFRIEVLQEAVRKALQK